MCFGVIVVATPQSFLHSLHHSFTTTLPFMLNIFNHYSWSDMDTFFDFALSKYWSMTSFNINVDLRGLSIQSAKSTLPLTLDNLSGNSVRSIFLPPTLLAMASSVTITGAALIVVVVNDPFPNRRHLFPSFSPSPTRIMCIFIRKPI